MKDQLASKLLIQDIERYFGQYEAEVITRNDHEYQSARLIYNRIHDHHPLALIRTRNISTIKAILKYTTDKELPLAIRGGGHHVAGFSSCEGGIVLDFSKFKEINYDQQKQVMEIEPGATLGDIDSFLCPMGVVLPTGTVSMTGIAGLTLGGGIGWQLGNYGLTCDQLAGADVVLANGELIHAEDEEHEYLLWGLRGGGGNFGVITKLRFFVNKLHQCTVGSIVANLKDAKVVLTRLCEFLKDLIDPSLTVAPVLTSNNMFEKILSIDFCLSGSSETSLDNLRKVIGSEVKWFIKRNADFMSWQKAFDHNFLPPMRGYWKAKYTQSLSSDDIDIIIEAFNNAPNTRTSIIIEHLHGAFKEKSFDFSAFPLRHANFGILFATRWENPTEDQSSILWARKWFEMLDPKGESITYSNYSDIDDTERVMASFTKKSLNRLMEVKNKYDSQNKFSRNHNIVI